jgi:hypothetical protein
MLPVTVLRLCCANALAAAFLHSNDPANAPTMVGLLHILCSTKVFPPKSALLQNSLAHVIKQAVLHQSTQVHINGFNPDRALKTKDICKCKEAGATYT